MTPQQIATASVLDILFENRNKTYGAYDLRANYVKRLWTALSVVPFVMLLMWVLQPAYKNLVRPWVNHDSTMVRLINPPPAFIPPPPPAAASPKVARGASVPTEIVPDNLVPQHKIENLITVGNVDGDPAILPAEAGTASNTTGPAITPVQPPAAPAADPSAIAVERLPQFPGGAAAWVKFLQKNLAVPAELGAGQKVQVQVRFTVSTDGRIENVEVVQSGGANFDAEVKRVLKKMPAWLPALQRGKPVAVSFVQPVTFAGVEE